MPVPNVAFHKFDVRRRIHKKREKYPSQDRFKNFIDVTIYASVIILPLFNLPQLLRIWITQNASGVSPISWFGFSFFAMIWTVYGFVHKEKPILYLNLVLMFMQLFIAIGALVYGRF